MQFRLLRCIVRRFSQAPTSDTSEEVLCSPRRRRCKMTGVEGSKQMKKQMFLLLAFSALVLAHGCTSWKFEGQTDNCSHESGSATVRRKYFVRAFDVKIGSNEYNQLAFGKNPPSIVDLCLCRPDVFESSAEGGDGSLSVSVYNEKEEYSKVWTLLVPYAVSLCILPAFLDCEDVYSVKVVMTDQNGKKQTTHFKMQIDTASKTSVYSPIGLIPYDRSPDCVAFRANAELGFGTLSDKAKRDRREVFLETVAYGTVAAIRMMEAGR